jgi:hypothetical protein
MFTYTSFLFSCCRFLVDASWHPHSVLHRDLPNVYRKNEGKQKRGSCDLLGPVTPYGWTCVINLMFCWPCITVYQYSENNVMHFLFNLLRIKGLYMFRALLAHPQEVLHKRHLVFACVLLQLVAPGLVQSNDTIRTEYTKCRLYNASWG